MNIFKYLKSLLWLYHFVGPEIKDVPAPNNWDGIPQPNLTWEEVFDKIRPSIVPFTFETSYEFCPICSKKLIDYKSDLQDMGEGRSQYMVRGEYCEEGHYTYMSCA